MQTLSAEDLSKCITTGVIGILTAAAEVQLLGVVDSGSVDCASESLRAHPGYACASQASLSAFHAWPNLSSKF